jgi:CheY-like chemotaxis protein
VPAKRGHMLVIDDEEMVRGLLGQMLQRLGYSVTRAGSAREGLSALEDEAAEICCVLST